MSWKCPECGNDNHEDLAICVCGYKEMPAVPIKAESGGSTRLFIEAADGNDRQAVNSSNGAGEFADGAGTTYYRLRDRERQFYLWVGGLGAVILGLTLFWRVEHGMELGLGGGLLAVFILFRKFVNALLKKNKALLTLYEDRMQVYEPQAQIVRYADIWEVLTDSDQVRIDVLDGPALSTVTINLNELEAKDAEEVVSFIMKKTKKARAPQRKATKKR